MGCCLWDPNECLPETLSKISTEMFYDLRHREIIEAMSDLYEVKVTQDIISLRVRLKHKGVLEQIGGVGYLNECQDSVPSPANLAYYVAIVRDKYMLRRVIQNCTSIIGNVYENESDVDQVFEEVEQAMLSLSVMRIKNESRTIKEIVHDVIDDIEGDFTRKGELSGVPTGFPAIDRATCGLQNTDFIILAARTSIGKTTLAMNIGQSASVEARVPTAVFSLEMSDVQLVRRMVCADARVNSRMISDGFLVDRDFPKITKAAGKISSAPLYIDQTRGMTMMKLRSLARQYVTKHNVKLIIIDYINLLYWDSGSTRFANRNEELSKIANALKTLAMDLNVPVVVLCQLNRDADRGGGQPQLHHLKDCGAIEEAADVVGFIYDDVPDQDQDGDSVSRMFKIAKQRNGPCPVFCPLTLLKTYNTFVTRSVVDDSDIPV